MLLYLDADQVLLSEAGLLLLRPSAWNSPAVTGVVRPGRSATDAGVGFIGGLNGTLVYRITDVWGLRAGYNLYWLTNAALAPTQYDFGAFVDSGARINDNGGIFLHGANLGVEARW